MKSLSALSQTYIERFPSYNQHYPLPAPAQELRVAIVMPAHRENLQATLASLESCLVNRPKSIEILLVINQAAADRDSLERHEQQVNEWQDKTLANGVVVHTLAALDLPSKSAGVGLARKLGMDKALERFAQVDHDGLVVGLDADCTVSENYLAALLQAESQPWQGLSLRYAHPTAGLDPKSKERIVNYEIWLRYYHLALKWSRYRHFHATVGSSMAVRASLYAKIGGMNQRKAGEDFYFLHKVMPHGHFGQLNELGVYPSARVSERVPFGTGRAMLEQEQGCKDFSYLYAPAIFEELQQLHYWVGQKAWLATQPAPAFWTDFLETFPKLKQSFIKMKQRSKNEQQWHKNFWFWWDGFNVLKFVHEREKLWPKVGREEALAHFWNLKGSPEELLQQLRELDSANQSVYF